VEQVSAYYALYLLAGPNKCLKDAREAAATEAEDVLPLPLAHGTIIRLLPNI